MKNTRDLMKAANARQAREAQRSGVIHRAATFTNRKREANRSACRGKVGWS